MVMSVDFCCFCGVTSSNGHAHSGPHKEGIRKFFSNKERADEVVRDARPTEHEKRRMGSCLQEVQHAVSPAQVHPTGSMGSGTALRGCHDLDLAVVVQDFDPQRPKDAACRMAEQLRQSRALRVCWTERHLVKVEFEGISADLLPTGRIELRRLMDLHDTFGWRGAMAIQHADIFGQMPAWKKDVVRLLKVWSRLILPVPGFLLQLIVRSVQDPGRDHLRLGFKQALQAIARGSRTWKDPVRTQDLVETRLDEAQWREFEQYAQDTLDMVSMVSLSAPGCDAPLQPALVKNSASRATYEPRPAWEGSHKFVSKGQYRDASGDPSGRGCVVKWFKSGSVYSEADFADDLNAITETKRIIAQFNQEAVTSKPVYVNEAQVWQKEETDLVGREKKLVEPFIRGTYERFNSNTGFQNAGFELMAALSHFSYHESCGKRVLCDLQGACYENCYVLTDPVVLSPDRKFGVTDLGQSGIDHFFSQHRCTKYCQPSWKKPANAREIFDVREGSSMIIGGGIRYGSKGRALALPGISE